MLYHLDFQIEYADNMSQHDLFTIWAMKALQKLEARLTFKSLYTVFIAG
jgi:hypothetical protein